MTQTKTNKPLINSGGILLIAGIGLLVLKLFDGPIPWWVVIICWALWAIRVVFLGVIGFFVLKHAEKISAEVIKARISEKL